jgi:pimeloyl-ACP methyl ester carboxylesterase
VGPFFFGLSSHQLFGLYEPTQSTSRRGVVLCQPWGQEYLRAHQSMRVLGRLLAREGLHVLRFDWYGSGDSGGTALDGGEPEAWLGDLELAIDELKTMAQIDRVALVGLRLGATVAAMAARTRTDIEQLVLWDPVADGLAYLREIATPASNVLHPNAYREFEEVLGGEVYAVHGFPMTPRMQKSIASVRPERFSAPLPPTLLVSTVPDPERYDPLRRRLAGEGIEVTDRPTEGPIAWMEEGDFGTSGMPISALREITGWLK